MLIYNDFIHRAEANAMTAPFPDRLTTGSTAKNYTEFSPAT
jgi:hypothetical protein